MYSYLALGDSYTYGELVPTEQSFPYQLVARLREQQVDMADPEVIAATGWTTAELQTGIAATPPHQQQYDLVTLLIGVNNQYRGLAKGYTIDGYKKEFTELLRQAIGFAGGKPDNVIVISIPDWSVMPVADGMDRAAI